jgi:hypothetical protein
MMRNFYSGFQKIRSVFDRPFPCKRRLGKGSVGDESAAMVGLAASRSTAFLAGLWRWPQKDPAGRAYGRHSRPIMAGSVAATLSIR